MKCPKCDFEFTGNPKFCPECGTHISQAISDTDSAQIAEKESTTIATNATEKKQSKKKRIIIISVLSTVIIGGLVALFFYLLFHACAFGKHEYSKLTVGQEPTCSADGYEYQYCLKCEKTLHTLPIKKLNHSYDGPCGQERTCVLCGEKQLLEHNSDITGHCEICGQYEYTVKVPVMTLCVSV